MPILGALRVPKTIGATKWWIKEVNADGTNLSPTADTYQLAYLRVETEVSISVSSETKADEGGKTHTLSGSKEAKLTLTIAENHAAAWNFAQQALTAGKYYAIVLQRVGPERGGNAAGKYEYQFFPICQLSGDLSARLPGTDLQLVFSLSPAPAAISQTLNSTLLPGYDGATGTAVCAAGEFMSPVVEVNPSA